MIYTQKQFNYYELLCIIYHFQIHKDILLQINQLGNVLHEIKSYICILKMKIALRTVIQHIQIFYHQYFNIFYIKILTLEKAVPIQKLTILHSDILQSSIANIIYQIYDVKKFHKRTIFCNNYITKHHIRSKYSFQQRKSYFIS